MYLGWSGACVCLVVAVCCCLVCVDENLNIARKIDLYETKVKENDECIQSESMSIRPSPSKSSGSVSSSSKTALSASKTLCCSARALSKNFLCG